MLLIEIPKGQIKIDSAFGIRLGFTSDLFSSDSYLWRIENAIWISLIFSERPGEGNFKKLIKNIHETGFDVKVPTPSGQMQAILNQWGFEPTMDDGCEVWKKEAPDASL